MNRYLGRMMRLVLIRKMAIFCSNLVLDYSKVLIVAPHPDDEVFGCTGLIQRLLSKEKEVYMLFFTRGEASHDSCCGIEKEELAGVRMRLAVNIDSTLGVDNKRIHFLNYPDNGIDVDCLETRRLDRLIKEIAPDIIFVPHHREKWHDHIECGRIIKELTKENPVIQLYEYCVWFWYYSIWKIDWKNARRLKMTKEELQRKNNAIDSYMRPLAPCGNPYSGILPELFIKANRWHSELYFKINKG